MQTSENIIQGCVLGYTQRQMKSRCFWIDYKGLIQTHGLIMRCRKCVPLCARRRWRSTGICGGSQQQQWNI